MNLENFLLLSAYLFCLGLYGLLTSKNIVRILMALEIMLNAANINFVAFSHFLDNQENKGQVISIFVMALAAAEAGVGLALLLAIARNKNSVDINKCNTLKE